MTMQKTFTPQYLKENCGCYSQERLLSCSFMTEKEISIQSILESEIKLKDKFWFLIKKTDLTIREKLEISIGAAEIVLEIYENKYPNNEAPREAIRAAKDYINGTGVTLKELNIKRIAADATTAAAAYVYDAADAANPKKQFQVILLQYLMDFVNRS